MHTQSQNKVSSGQAPRYYRNSSAADSHSLAAEPRGIEPLFRLRSNVVNDKNHSHVLASRNKNDRGRGLVKTAVVVIIAVTLLVYFSSDVRDFFYRDDVKNFIAQILNIIFTIWDGYVKVPATFLWDKLVVGILWGVIIKGALGYISEIRQ
ncbi:MAG: hypothetical protein A3G52_01950 [Candidatus Taylorbacteria bacterium RIFCSPLOWO2_12_FULL_43_20]|uniref:Uncharacterized protein n=1 Tax=Candidatus Taylorbacteria bacterium RIFCSPLOWO2_12_FULL_43_20 TaxID=1802332 RepID=A0A1G2P3X8_9BACT|nr:MAG: hypothetical protein A2825_02835 [Candidatus Taylorbacteria bacterium RIFCSPHIGHO2_01_FULL_43_120]OHA23015.1 MAG: hypothetical protein A3B98_01920 [Candidatus Taylorbacteria bacterium RIFCSPHIGHO2_02_FULL_43_55]OHA30131.1 MAG: hypothetical protein A3E92_00955 [Candidatus Taylorbacteria bacterium RIFCSPHIGHO2_12_FULL_42_34]OHA30729.1 MAG: hypothetical protein A3B09_01710 [Candidatus Taylorbacteria bacterium RIFCSPLOWO2_01_FULL_43_83]OHA39602.1 MAG: hypothetical protein A3H58_02395 [Candi